MRIKRCAACLLSILAGQTLFAAALEHSVSPSQQFIIYGAEASSRGAISELAESTKANLLALLRRPDEWKTPIVLNLQWPRANLPEMPPAALYFSQTGFGLKLQLDLTITPNVDRALLERALLRAILLEMMYRSEPQVAPGTVFVEPPDWLLDGVIALSPGRDRTPLIEALTVSEKITPFEEFLRQRRTLSELDSPARQLYRAYSLALVQLLVDETNGRARLARYIANLVRASNDPLADLRLQFPELTAQEAGKIWKSEIARLRTAQQHELLSFAESERSLDELLKAKISPDVSSSGSGQLSDLAQRKLSQSVIAALNRLNLNLLLLAARANPVLRPTIQEYQRIVRSIAAGKHRGTVVHLARVEATRAKLAARMSEVDDYLNWCEATKSKTKSGVFASYLSSAEEQNDARPHRHDAVSVYLDALEEQF
jgi:hypothetical protein